MLIVRKKNVGQYYNTIYKCGLLGVEYTKRKKLNQSKPFAESEPVFTAVYGDTRHEHCKRTNYQYRLESKVHISKQHSQCFDFKVGFAKIN